MTITMSSLRAFALVVAATATVTFVAPARAAEDDVFVKERLVGFLNADNGALVVATFKRYPGRTLPFIDSFLEGGLAMIEKDPAKEADAMQSFRTGVKFAKLADEAFGGTAFTDYATSFASWSPSERVSFREGQRLFREGMKTMKDDPKAAIASFEQSLRLADSLGDTWGRAMAWGGLAQAHAKIGGDNRALAADAATTAAELYGQVRLTDDAAQALITLADVVPTPQGKITALRKAWYLASQDQTIELATRIVIADRLATELEALKDASFRPIRDAHRRLTEEAAAKPK
ncbi:MAG: hypothetical protein JNM94_17295 [Phycisphaerae bacterium]|nr:hypothetical protein [Phycisphaerae bacterium]